MQPAADPCIGSTNIFTPNFLKPSEIKGMSNFLLIPKRCCFRKSTRSVAPSIGIDIPPASNLFWTESVKELSTEPPKGPLIFNPNHSHGLWLAVITSAPSALSSTIPQLQEGVGSAEEANKGTKSTPLTADATASAISSARNRRS